MSIGRQNMYASLVEHSFGPVSRISTEKTSKRAGRELYPNAGLHQPLDGLVVRLDPAKPLWMGEDWNVARHQYIEKQVFQAGGCNVMWWFDQDVARISQGKQMAGSQICDKTWHDVVISAGYQPELNFFPVEDLLQLRGGLADLRARIMVQTRKNMWRTGYDRYTISDESSGHLKRDRKLGSAIVDARQDMAVQINHGRRSTLRGVM